MKYDWACCNNAVPPHCEIRREDGSIAVIFYYHPDHPNEQPERLAEELCACLNLRAQKSEQESP